MSTTISGTTTAGGVAQLVAPLNASASISISNPSADPIILAYDGNPAGPQNGIVVSGTTVIDNANNNPGLWPYFSAASLNQGVAFSLSVLWI